MTDFILREPVDGCLVVDYSLRLYFMVLVTQPDIRIVHLIYAMRILISLKSVSDLVTSA